MRRMILGRQTLLFLGAILQSSHLLFPTSALSPLKEVSCVEGPNGEEECEALYDDDSGDEDYDEEIDYDDDYDDEEMDSDEGYDVKCADRDEKCSKWAEDGDCDSNPGFMTFECAVSCKTCDDRPKAALCRDTHHKCDEWAGMGECDNNPRYMRNHCKWSCFECFVDTNQFGIRQDIPFESEPSYNATLETISNSTSYMKHVWSDSDHQRVRHKCKNMHESCSFWAALGECENNPGYMKTNCAPACQTCELLDILRRCPTLPGNDPVWKPGDLNKFFENVVDNADGSGEYLKYNPKAMSRPKLKRDGTAATGVEVDGPWVITLENFISDEEADALIAVGQEKGYERSSDVGKELPDGSHEAEISDSRTSHNAWCDDESCAEDPIIGPVIERIANVTKTNIDNSEHLQLLQYEPGQYYKQHHDYIEYQHGLPCGVRMLTLFLYLNDVEEGGATSFPLLDLAVTPKKGNAVLWPSVLDESPEEKDARTDHEALPVIKGIKYGANAWIHTRNFMDALEIDCA